MVEMVDRHGGEYFAVASFADFAAFPPVGEPGIGYVDTSSEPNPLYRWDTATSAYVQIGGGDTCPDPMTRAALLTLRNSGGLTLGCRYTITDPPATGNFAPTALVFDAVSATELDREGEAVVPWSPNPVTVFYDIDGNGYVRVIDHVRNDVRGNNAQIGQFPWGVANVYGNTLVDTTLTYNTGNFYLNELTGSTVTVNSLFHTNMVIGSTVSQGGGTLSYNSVTRGSILVNGDLTIFQCEIGASLVNTTGSVGAGLRNCTFTNTFSANTMQNVADLDWAQVSVRDSARVLISGAARSYARYLNLSGYAYVSQSGGTSLDLDYSSLSDGSSIQVQAGWLYASGTEVVAGSAIQNGTSGTNRVLNAHVSSNGLIRFVGTATGCQCYYSRVSSGSRIEFTNGATNSYVYYCSADMSSFIQIDDSIDARVYYSAAQTQSRITVRGQTGQFQLYFCTAEVSSQINAVNGAGGGFYSLHVSAQSIVNLNDSAQTSRLFYSSFTAYYYLTMDGSVLNTTRTAWHGYGRRSNTLTTLPPNGTYVQNF